MNIKTFSLVCGLAVHLLAQPAVAGPFEDAVAAYDRGDYATAAELLWPLAEQGDATAQFNLGFLYAMDLGVPQDFVQAHMWLNLAAAAGHEKAAEVRDEFVAKKITPEQIAQAQRMAREWLAAHPNRQTALPASQPTQPQQPSACASRNDRLLHV